MLQSDSEVSDVVKNFRKKSAFGCWSGAFFCDDGMIQVEKDGV